MPLTEVPARYLLLKLLLCYQVVVFLVLFDFLCRSSGIASFLLEDSLVLCQDLLQKRIFADTRWSDQDEWLASLGSRVEWMEVLLGVDEHIVWLVEQHATQEVIEHFSDFGVTRDVLFVLLNQGVLACAQVRQHFIVKVYFVQVHVGGLVLPDIHFISFKLSINCTHF